MNRLQGKVAVVTGGNSGIGLAAAKRLRDEGATVIIVGRNRQKVDQAVKDLGDRVSGLVADVAVNADLDRVYQDIRKDFGKIDVLFANAGVAFFAPVSDVNEEFFDRITGINQRGLFFTIQKALPVLGDGASVIVNTSVVNEIGLPNASIYSATKAAARNLVRGLAGELAERGIRVNAVAPGPVETPIFEKTQMPAEALDAFAQDVVAKVTLKRFGKPEEIAAAVAFLASEDASFITGAEIPVDGGMTQV